MNSKIKLVLSLAFLLTVSACSTIKTYFPDKEKDYQFTTEIPPLILPPDLAGDSLAKIPVASVTPATPISEASAAPQTTPKSEAEPAVDRKLIQLEIVGAEQGTQHLRISAPTVTAWRMVGKALSRKNIEVTDHNQEKALFRVQFDPNQIHVEDDSFLDEINFFLNGFHRSEREFVLKLVENNAQTDVIILDKDEKPVSDSVSLSLLTLLHDTLKADLSVKK